MEDELDALIGELEREAARRRASPDFPIDAEANLHFELERRAPRPLPIAGLQDLARRLSPAPESGVGSRSGAVKRRAPWWKRASRRRQSREIGLRVEDVALTLHEALDLAGRTLADLSRRVDALEQAIGGRGSTEDAHQFEEERTPEDTP